MSEIIRSCFTCDRRLSAEDQFCAFCGRSTDDAVTSRSLDGPTLPSAAEQTAKKTWQLMIIRPNGEQTISVLRERTTIGRSPRNDIQLDDQQVSRFHAVIEKADGGFTISDMESMNGTSVNRRAIRIPAVLNAGDAITIGRYRLMIQRTNFRCARCRQQMHVDDHFCRFCGAPLTGVKNPDGDDEEGTQRVPSAHD